MINVRGRAARERALVLALRRQLAHERPLARAVGSVLARQGRAAANIYLATASEADALVALEALRPELERALAAHYQRVTADFGAVVFDALKQAPIALETKGLREWFNVLMYRWIKAEAAAKVTGIQQTTRKLLQAAIRVGVRQGEGQDGVADLIRQRVGDMSAARAGMIARTETHNAANHAQLEAAKGSGVVETKEWLSAEDSRTRPSHALADEQKRGLDEPFDVGGALLQRPGDPSGAAREVINCRCTMLFNA